ncbi:MAG: hypothetical protein SGJ16_07300 [Nitrospirota bacterium]|nr:hypothetical protein [Nitrospirota bacterium]
MKQFVLLVLLMCPAAVYPAETEPPKTPAEEPKLYDHFVGMQQTEKGLSKRSNEEQARLQPQIRRAELQACQRVRQDRQEGGRDDDYRRQGGDDFVAYVLQFERYCETLR